MMQAHPLCPITGLPTLRRIQPISGRLIRGLWRGAFGVATERQLGVIEHFELWESPCGLAFFEPMVEGDEAFYLDLYRQGDFHRQLTAPGLARAEFRRVAELVRPGEKILDVGCGEGGLARHVPQATYIGLDPNFSPQSEGPDVRNETVAAHAAHCAAAYDAVCAFHVIEHVSDPLTFARDLALCVRPGGRLYIAVPGWGSPMTDIPNFVFNAPPHHLSWWNERALRALANRIDLAVEAVEPVPFSSHDSIIYWMGRFAPKLAGERYFRAHWTWYGALAWSWLAGRVCNALFQIPTSARPSGLLLLARKPS
jgi:2-polyprenyl-3-methyl-5-hydroxy-6-metoxy-1,4-benzoquinol methylase